ncbi:MAG: hypothetical protein NC177_10460 [Ruminococcus flavefaciens]|nr:hypothetical protein [Ruminococcus flavefaciens]
MAVFFVVMAVVGINKRQTNKRIHDEKIELGKKNACAWIKKKYGVDVEAVDASIEWEDGNDYEGDTALVSVSDGDKEYKVEISCVEENAEGYDDYQTDEIENAIIDMIKSDIPTDIEYIFYGNKRSRQRYNGKNLNQLLDGFDSLYVYCMNTEFEEVPVFDFLRDNIRVCEFYSFSSEEAMKDFIEKQSQVIAEYSAPEYYAPFINSYRVVKFPKSDNDVITYNVEKFNDIIYYPPNENADGKLEKGFKEMSESDFKIKKGYEFISAYSLKDKYSNTIVWIPIPDDKKDKEFYFYIEYTNYRNKKFHKMEKCEIIGGYAVYNVGNDMQIALLCK